MDEVRGRLNSVKAYYHIGPFPI